MGLPLFTISAACRLDITVGSTTYAAYYALVAQYQFGTPIIPNRAPEELASALGIPFYTPTDPGIADSVPGVVVVTFPYPTASVVVAGTAYPVSTADPGGILTGVNYIDSNGVLWPDVEWQWAISVEPYISDGGGAEGQFDIQIIRYTGDGGSNRQINTTALDLTLGDVAITIQGTPASDYCCFRHNGSAMLGTSLVGSSSLQTTSGIMSFNATGFTVTDGNVVGQHFANKLNTKYTAIVIRDTSGGRWLRIGGYTGLGSFNLAMTITFIDPGHGFSLVSGVFLPVYSGLTFTDGTGSYVFTYIDGTHGMIQPAYGTLTGTVMAFSGDNRPVPLGGLPGVSMTHVWIWGRGVAYRSTDFVGDASVSLAKEAYPITDVIQDFIGNTVVVGTQNNVNNNNTKYYYMALARDTLLASKNLFASFTGVGTGPPTTIAGIGFAPGIAFARRLSTVLTGGVWKGADHVGTDSQFMAAEDLPTTGITAISAAGGGSVSVGVEVAPAGITFYGWAFAGGTVPIVTYAPAPPPPPGTPPSPNPPPVPGPIPPGPVPPVPPTGGPVPPFVPSDGGGGQACRIGSF